MTDATISDYPVGSLGRLRRYSVQEYEQQIRDDLYWLREDRAELKSKPLTPSRQYRLDDIRREIGRLSVALDHLDGGL